MSWSNPHRPGEIIREDCVEALGLTIGRTVDTWPHLSPNVHDLSQARDVKRLERDGPNRLRYGPDVSAELDPATAGREYGGVPVKPVQRGSAHIANAIKATKTNQFVGFESHLKLQHLPPKRQGSLVRYRQISIERHPTDRSSCQMYMVDRLKHKPEDGLAPVIKLLSTCKTKVISLRK